jgi:hypothetical protein
MTVKPVSARPRARQARGSSTAAAFAPTRPKRRTARIVRVDVSSPARPAKPRARREARGVSDCVKGDTAPSRASRSGRDRRRRRAAAQNAGSKRELRAVPRSRRHPRPRSRSDDGLESPRGIWLELRERAQRGARGRWRVTKRRALWCVAEIDDGARAHAPAAMHGTNCSSGRDGPRRGR